MKLLFSIPGGFHWRELVLPLHSLLEADTAVTKILCVTPGAPRHAAIFTGYSDKFEFTANPADAAGTEALLSVFAPDVVITTTAGLDHRDTPLLSAAQRLGIRTFTFIASWDNVWKIERFIREHKPIVLADRLAVWNTMMTDHLRRLFPDLSPERIIRPGVPRFDYFFDQKNIPAKNDLYRRLAFDQPDRPLIHLSTTELYPMDYLAASLRAAIHNQTITGQPYLLATVHPGGNLARHQSLERYGVVVRYAFGRRDEAPIPEFRYAPRVQDILDQVALFTYSSVLINHSSTTAIESLIAGVPVINVRYGQPLDWWRWHRSMVYRDFNEHYQDILQGNGTTVVNNSRQLISAVSEALVNPEKKHEQRAATVRRMITATDGMAAARMLAAIKDLA